MNPKETQEMEKLKVQVRWLNEQLEGHEDNFAKQFDKIESLKSLLTQAKEEIETLVMEISVERAKFASLASYVSNTENSALNKILRPPNYSEIKVLSAVTAYKASTYELFFYELKKLLELGEDDDDMRLQLHDELCALTEKLEKEVDRHVKKLGEQV